jgi:hypothetical protein
MARSEIDNLAFTGRLYWNENDSGTFHTGAGRVQASAGRRISPEFKAVQLKGGHDGGKI